MIAISFFELDCGVDNGLLIFDLAPQGVDFAGELSDGLLILEPFIRKVFVFRFHNFVLFQILIHILLKSIDPYRLFSLVRLKTCDLLTSFRKLIHQLIFVLSQ